MMEKFTRMHLKNPTRRASIEGAGGAKLRRRSSRDERIPPFDESVNLAVQI